MTLDLWALVATLGLAMVQVGIQSIATLRQLGPRWVLSPRDEAQTVTGVSGRIVRAHHNLLDILPQFAAALFVVHMAGVNGQYAVIGAWVFFVARAIYLPAYILGPTGLRPLCWVAAQTGILIILWDIIG